MALAQGMAPLGWLGSMEMKHRMPVVAMAVVGMAVAVVAPAVVVLAAQSLRLCLRHWHLDGMCHCDFCPC